MVGYAPACSIALTRAFRLTSIVCALFVFVACIPTLLLHNIYVYNTSIDITQSANSTLLVGTMPTKPDSDIAHPVDHEVSSFGNIQLSTTTVKAPLSSLPHADVLYYTMDIDRESCTFFKFNLWLNAILLKVARAESQSGLYLHPFRPFRVDCCCGSLSRWSRS